MDTTGKAHTFISRFQWNQVPIVSEAELLQICELPVDELSPDDLGNLVFNLSYLTLNEDVTGQLSLQTIEKLIGQDKALRDDIVDLLIERLQPLLLRTEVERNIKKPGLRPTTGFSIKADESRRKWRQDGGLKSIPLFYTVLLNLSHHKLSSNLWWITPGILNLLDDTTDLTGTKLRGVFLLRTFLQNVFQDDKRWLSFEDTGLFKLYEPLLKNMCYYLPPVHSAEECMLVWKEVFPTLDVLYSLQFKESPADYRRHLGDFMSELILQQVIPRVSMTNEMLAVFILETLISQLRKLGGATLYYLSRVIYTLGEYLVRDPFVTSFEDILDRIVETLHVLLSVCPSDRIIAHKYDFLALLAIIFDKCKQEGKLTDPLGSRLRGLVRILEDKGCDFSSDKPALIAAKNIADLFTSD